MLVKFECGCVGFPPRGDRPEDHALLVRACDDDGTYERQTEDYFLFYRSHMVEKSFAPLDAERESKIITILQDLLRDGEALRGVRRDLRSAITLMKSEG